MDFPTWLERSGKSLSQVQRAAGVAYTTALAVKRGEALSRRDVAEKISEATGGEVSPEELLWPERGGEAAE